MSLVLATHMTDEEVDTQFSVFAIMLSAPFVAGDHGELPLTIRDDIQAILWEYGYIPAQQMLIECGATQEQVNRARLAKEAMFKRRVSEGPTVIRKGE